MLNCLHLLMKSFYLDLRANFILPEEMPKKPRDKIIKTFEDPIMIGNHKFKKLQKLQETDR